MTSIAEPSAYEAACNGGGPADHGRVVREVLDRVGDKWSVLVIGALRGQRLRFTELLHAIPGISQRMLTLTVRQLERDGLLTRTVHAEVPPRVEYELTDRGRGFVELALALAEWAIEHREGIEASRAEYDARA